MLDRLLFPAAFVSGNIALHLVSPPFRLFVIGHFSEMAWWIFLIFGIKAGIKVAYAASVLKIITTASLSANFT